MYLQMTLKSLPEDGHIKSQLCTAEIRESPTKPSGKGSKRKQDELDEDDYMDEEEEEQEAEEEEGRQTWVEALTQELEDEGPDVDPDYEVGDLCKPSLGCLTNVPPHMQRLHILYSLDLIFFQRWPCLVGSLHGFAWASFFYFALLCCTCHPELVRLQPSTVETESEEYRSQNGTESDIEV